MGIGKEERRTGNVGTTLAFHARGTTNTTHTPHNTPHNTPHPHLACTSPTWHEKPVRRGICRSQEGEWRCSLHSSAAVREEIEGGVLHSCSHLQNGEN